MIRRRVWFMGAVLFLGPLNMVCQEKTKPMLAATPPMGWNSWDGYGTTITEDQFKANAAWLAKRLKPQGWQYVVVDMEWFVINPIPEGNSKNSQFSLDSYGRFTPATNRFPSSAKDAGFKPLADYVHSLGLKFGIHILRGIPREAVEKNLAIEGSSFRATDAADTSETCPWNPDNYGLDTRKPGAQAYYDSIARLYAGWEVDLIKVDCIASHPYRGDEIRMLSEALRKTGRPIVLSLSPGAAPIDKIDEMRQNAQMWRISDDIWDLWHSTVAYPQGLGDQFANVDKWAGLSQPGHWPDADMLPLGRLAPAPGWGKARETKLSHDEQRTLMTLWCIFPSPLMIGGELPSADGWTVSLLTNPEVIAVDQHSSGNHPVIKTDNSVVWLANSDLNDNDKDTHYVALFNVGESKATLRYDWKDLGLTGKTYRPRDLWQRRDLASSVSMAVTLPPHGSALYRLSPADR
ncbi:MAG TPA: glycoside hydrolase family 27 protein [Candidatus Sulfotelmatobacter sp.]|nr:glycoside hydrolase family 27 protein [Candidatus Sulfotelmatobacter sp.]